MLFLIMVVLIIIGIVLMHNDNENVGSIWTIGFLSVCIGVVGTAIAGGFLSEGYMNVRGKIKKLNNRYESLVYQYEHDIYDNDNDLGKRDLMEDIQRWNEDLAWYQGAQNDFWIGIFIPDIYDQFNYIVLE